MKNGHKRNITIFDERTICFLDNLRKSTGQTWDDTLKMLITQNRQERDKMLDLKLKELHDWVGFAYPDRPDISNVIEKARVLIANPFLMSEPDRMFTMGNRLLLLQRDLIMEFKKKGKGDD